MVALLCVFLIETKTIDEEIIGEVIFIRTSPWTSCIFSVEEVKKSISQANLIQLISRGASFPTDCPDAVSSILEALNPSQKNWVARKSSTPWTTLTRKTERFALNFSLQFTKCDSWSATGAYSLFICLRKAGRFFHNKFYHIFQNMVKFFSVEPFRFQSWNSEKTQL